ncbi:unnamed protein product [Blepharisma stoltei]|uniref:Ubiquitin-conjugating enzyme E2 n=1 Tax=Blepharisma stoltei TaxID=1481888 RepID=A0AAU9IRS2_9CILI|nr:unnamed protein product [Blepharisma stoltei]
MDQQLIDLLVEVPGKGPLIIAAPSTLDELLLLISQYSSYQKNDISILYKRKETWFGIIDQATYSSILKRAQSASQSEIEIKVEISASAPQNQLEELKTEVSWEIMSNVPAPAVSVPETLNESEATPLIQYRYLNSADPETFNQLRIPALDITLEDLSNLVLQLENKPPADFICAFYSEDGCPLYGSLSQMPFIKCNEVIPGSCKLNVMIVPNFDVKSLPSKDPNEGSDTVIFQSSADLTKTFTVKVNLSTTTIQDLKQKLYSLTLIPTFEAKFKSNDIFLTNDTFTLSSYNINQNQTIIYWKESYDYTTRTYKPILKRTVEQTIDGIKLFHSFLYCFSNVIGTCEKPTREAILGMIRQASQNNTPLLHALYELSIGKNMSLLDSIALEEGFIFIISHLVKELNATDKVSNDKLFENCLEVIGLLCEIGCKPTEEYSRDETYLEYDTICPLSLVELKNPVCLRKIDGTYAYYEHEAVLKRAQEHTEIVGVGLVKESQIKISKDFVYPVKRAIYNEKESIILWTGTFDRSNTFPNIIRASFPQGLVWDQLLQIKKNYKLSKIHSALSLKSSETRHCITLDKNKEIVVNRGLSPKEPNTVELMNILTRDVSKYDIDDMASIIERISRDDPAIETITRPPDETIIVIFDKSGSMGTTFGPEGEYTRLDATKQFFESFADRTVGYNLNHVMSLFLFSTTIDRACGFTENISTFTAVAHQSKHSGGTKLWDAIYEAIQSLVEFKVKYPNTHLRILCLSDGEDTSSTHGYLQVAQQLIANNVIMDSVVVGDLSQNLKAISYASGGYVFLPATLQDGIKLFESETLLSVRNRKSIVKCMVNTDNDLEPLRRKEINNQQPAMAAPAEISQGAVTAEQALKKMAASPPAPQGKSGSAGCVKRIMKELQNISTNPHENIVVLPNDNDIMFWNLYIEGPEQTPYEGGLFQAFARFPNDYPFKPPTIKFVTPIYHCNINSTGSICHSILNQFYSPAVTVRHMLDCIYGLLMTPEPMDPLDAYIAAEIKDDYELYISKCREHIQLHASKSFEELTGMKKPVSGTVIPEEFLDPISKRIMSDPVIIHGKTYERSEIERVIDQTGKDPDGNEANKADLVQNAGLLQRIDEFKQAHP